MKVLKSLNSSVVLATDDTREWILLGKGFGYGARPGDDVDESAADRIFMNIPGRSFVDVGGLSALTPERLSISDEIVVMAEETLNVELSPYLPIALADHLAFAFDRPDDAAPMPAFWDLESYYPEEYGVALRALGIIYERTGRRLPASEAASITLHLVNAEQPKSGFSDIAKMNDFLDWLDGVIPRQHGEVNEKARMRLLGQGRSLFQRVMQDDLMDGDADSLLAAFLVQRPDLEAPLNAVESYLVDRVGVRLPDEEKVHLALYLQPLVNASTSAS